MAKRDIEVRTRDGISRASLHTPGGAKAGVILYMDAFGVRPALDEMAERMSRFGYAVLVPDLFYRQGPYGPYNAKTAFSDEQNAAQIRSMMDATTQAMTQDDTGSFIEALAREGVTGPIGTVGYCMGGARALNAAAAHPGPHRAAASFHGGNLASDAPDSPQQQARQDQGARLCRLRRRRQELSAGAVRKAG